MRAKPRSYSSTDFLSVLFHSVLFQSLYFFGLIPFGLIPVRIFFGLIPFGLIQVSHSKLDCGDRQNFEVYRRLDTVSHKLIVKKLVGHIPVCLVYGKRIGLLIPFYLRILTLATGLFSIVTM